MGGCFALDSFSTHPTQRNATHPISQQLKPRIDETHATVSVFATEARNANKVSCLAGSLFVVADVVESDRNLSFVCLYPWRSSNGNASAPVLSSTHRNAERDGELAITNNSTPLQSDRNVALGLRTQSVPPR